MELKMNRNKEHNQKVFIQMYRTVETHNCTTYDEIAEALNAQGVLNTSGEPYSAVNLRNMVSRWNKETEDNDFRQKYYPMHLFLKDEEIGLKQAHIVPRKNVKTREVSKRDELKKLFTQHEINYFGWTDTSVPLSA